MTYLDRFLDSVVATFSSDVARRVAELRVSPDIQARADQLASKANEGSLTAEESGEYHELVTALDIVSILQAKSQRVIAAERN